MSNLALRVTDCKPYIANKSYRLAIKPYTHKKETVLSSFQLNDYVKNIDGLTGIIQSKDDAQVIVKWQDNTIERIRTNILDTGYLMKTSEPVKISENSKKVKSLEKKLANKDLLKDKNLGANELVDLAIAKGIVEPEDKDMELLRIQSMSDNEFLLYQELVLTTDAIEGEVSSLSESNNDYTGLSPEEIRAHQELDKLKRSGRYIPSNPQCMSSSGSRSLSDIRAESGISDLHNVQMPMKLENSFYQQFGGIFNSLPGQSQKMEQTASMNNQFVNNIDNQQTYIEVPTITDFIDSKDYGLSDTQKTTISDGYNTVQSNLSVTDKCGFSVYQNSTGKYVAVTTPTGTGTEQTCEEMTQFNTEKENINNQIEPYETKKLADMEFSSVLDSAIAGSKAKNAKAVRALLDIDTLKASKNQSDDIQKAIEEVRSQNDYLFEGTNIPGGGGNPPGGEVDDMAAVRTAMGLKNN